LRAIQRGESVLWTTYVSGFTLNMDETPFRQGTLPLPVLAEYAPPVSINGLFISRRAADPQACWDWMVFLTENLEYGNNMPARPSIMASAAWETAVGPEQAELYRTIAAQSFPPGNIWGETDVRVSALSFWLGRALKAAQEGTDVATALAEAQRLAETYLACMAETPDAGVAESQQCQEQVGPSWLASTLEE
jgi:ABC-type glycerol-3-phosphate transport system substrate-binding protein